MDKLQPFEEGVITPSHQNRAPGTVLGVCRQGEASGPKSKRWGRPLEGILQHFVDRWGPDHEEIGPRSTFSATLASKRDAFALLAVLVSTQLGCSSLPERQDISAYRAPVEGNQMGLYFTVASDLNTARGAQARYQEQVSRSTGALLVPVSALGDPSTAQYTAEGTQVRSTCGVAFISPSLAVTAAHCVSDMEFLPELQVEMYRPTSQLGDTYLKASSLSGFFPGFEHERLTDADGYLTDRYPCSVVARCSADWGPPIGCDIEADVAVLRCEGKPGFTYGYTDVAEQDDPNTSVFMPWKHELYDASSEPGNDTWDHYVRYTVDPTTGSGDRAANYHYHGRNSAGVEQNQLLPLLSINFPDGTQTQKLSSSSVSVSTNLLGCHGTSGSSVFQPGPSGSYELLGPVRRGTSEHESYLCNHFPAYDGSFSTPFSLGISYTPLAATQALFDAVSQQLATDCQGIDPTALALAPTSLCDRHIGSNHLQASSKLTPNALTPLPRQLYVVTEAPQLITTLPVTAGEALLLSWQGRAPCDSEPSTECGSLQINLSYADAAAPASAFTQPVPASLTSRGLRYVPPIDGTVNISFSLPAGTPPIEVTPLVHRRESDANQFDTPVERQQMALLDLETNAEPMPARFSGDGQHGFAARLLPSERLLWNYQALTPGSTWSARFDVIAGLGQPLRCGILADDGTIVSASDCSDGFVSLSIAPDAPDGSAFYVETAPSTGADSPLEVDNLRLQAAGDDWDADGVADPVDRCPYGLLPANSVPDAATLEALAGGTVALSSTETTDSTVLALCAPNLTPLSLAAASAAIQLPSTCEPATLDPWLVGHGSSAVDPPVPLGKANMTLPVGHYQIEWRLVDRGGRIWDTLTTPLEVQAASPRQCCERVTTLTEAADELPESSDACVDSLAGDDAVFVAPPPEISPRVWAGAGSDFVHLWQQQPSQAVATISLGSGDDVFAVSQAARVVVLDGPGNDTVHALGASQAVLLGDFGADTLVGSTGDDEIYVGPQTVLVSAEAGDDEIVIFDVCEVSGSHLVVDGGPGYDRLVSPVDASRLAELGVTLNAIEQVVVDDTARYRAACFGGRP